MAESITYADLRFVKAPLKNATCQLGQDEDEDGDITYENVQVCPAPGAIASLASSAPVDKAGAGLSSEQQPPLWPSSTPPTARRILRGPVTCMQYVLLGLLLVSLLLGVAAICLGVRYLQVFRQLQMVHRALESTNSSLGQRLSLAQARLQQREEELQASRQQLDQKEESLSRKEQEGLNTQKQLEDCNREQEETKVSLQREQTQRESLDERLRNIREKLKQLYKCRWPGERIVGTVEDFCCPVGWILKERTCFHISLTKRSWQESEEYCRSLSSDLASTDYYYSGPVPVGRTQDSGLVPGDQNSPQNDPIIQGHRIPYPAWRGSGGRAESAGAAGWVPGVDAPKLYETREALKSLLNSLQWPDPFWIRSKNKDGKISWYNNEKRCLRITKQHWIKTEYHTCEQSLPCICELEAIRHPDMEHFLH